MDRAGNVRKVMGSSLAGWRRGLSVSEEAKVRAASAVLWVLVLLAVLGGLSAWLRPAGRSVVEPAATSTATASESWAAAGFGARFVSSYLGADADAEDAAALAGFLGYTPEAPAADRQGDEAPVSVTIVGVEPVAPAYWAVTVAARGHDAEQHWSVGVSSLDGSLVAAGPPTPVPAPTMGERAALAIVLSSVPPVDDAVLETVAGFVTAYACGDGDVARYLAPDAVLAAVVPAVCGEARIVGWGTRPDGAQRVSVAAEVLLDPDTTARRVGFALGLERRDGRWEVAELLSVPPLAVESSEEVDP